MLLIDFNDCIMSITTKSLFNRLRARSYDYVVSVGVSNQEYKDVHII